MFGRDKFPQFRSCILTVLNACSATTVKITAIKTKAKQQPMTKNHLTGQCSIDIIEHEYKRQPFMKFFDWNDKKNALLKKERGVSFEQVELAIASGDLLDRIRHPNTDKYSNQKVFLVRIEDYVYSVPYVEDVERIFLKTIIPNSKATKKYFGGKT